MHTLLLICVAEFVGTAVLFIRLSSLTVAVIQKSGTICTNISHMSLCHFCFMIIGVTNVM